MTATALPRLLAALTLVWAVLGTAAAGGQPPRPGAGVCGPLDPAQSLPFATQTTSVGVVDLHFFLAHGAPVTYYECLGDRPRRLGSNAVANGDITSLLAAVPWSCDRLVRHFAAVTTLPDGRVLRGLASSRTPSCAKRFGVTAPARARRGRAATVRLTDRWGIGGIHVRRCLRSPDGSRQCRTVAFAKAVAVRTQRFRPDRRGRWMVDLQVRGFHVRATVAVGVAPVRTRRPQRLVVTGDSTAMGVDSALSDQLPEYAVQSEVHPGTGVSKVDWSALARDQTRIHRQAVTVISLGANEGFPLTVDGRAHDCCDDAWQFEYRRRVRALMDVYRQGGRARVYYLTVPIPRAEGSAALVRLVNAAIVEAGRGVAGVHVLRMDRLFSPEGYRETIRDHGRTIHVREADGVHLNASGQAIEARETAAAIRGRPTTVPDS